MMVLNLQLGRILFSSAIVLLASSMLSEGKSFGSAEEEDRNEVNQIGKGLQDFLPKSPDNSVSDDSLEEERTNEIWNNLPLMPRFNFRDTGNWWSSSTPQIRLDPLSPNSLNLPPRKRLSPGDGHNKNNNNLKPLALGQQQLGQQQVLSNYLSNYGPGLSSNGLVGSGLHGLTGTGSGGPGFGTGFRYRPVSYNFRNSPNGRLSGFMAPVSPRKRQILFRQCFFNPISCF